MSDPQASIRRTAGWALVAGLTVAALTAVGALLAGEFDETSERVIATSLGFAFASVAAAAGASLRHRSSGALAVLGAGTIVLAALAFVLLAAGLWTSLDDDEAIWRLFGCAALAAIAGAHACVVLGARRPSDSDAVTALVLASLLLAAVDTVGGLLPISGLVDDVDDGMAKLLAAILVMLVLTSVLQPILRRTSAPPAAPPPGRWSASRARSRRWPSASTN